MSKQHNISLPSGEEVLAEELSFDPIEERWNLYELDDGTFIKVKLTVSRIFQVVDEQGEPKKLDSGDRYVVVRHRVDIVHSEVS